MVDKEWQDAQIDKLRNRVMAIEPDARLYKWSCELLPECDLYRVHNGSWGMSEPMEDAYMAWRDAARKLGVY